VTPIDISKIPHCTETELKQAFRSLESFRKRLDELPEPIRRFVAERLLAGLPATLGDEGAVP
jgi:hypothetical protein